MRPSTCAYYALLALAACTPTPDLTPVRFTDVTAACGLDFRMHSGNRVKNYIIEAKGGGGAFLDYDGDGWLDIYLVNGSRLEGYPDPATAPTNALYRNMGDGTFANYTRTAGVGDAGWGMGCAAADYDQDGDLDLYVTNYGPNVLYRNEGNGRFRDVGQAAGVDLAGWSTGASFGDYDGDGDPDLYVAQYLHFAPERVPPRGGMWKGVLVFAGPLGLPGAQDVLYRNEGNSQFRDVTRQAKAGQFAPTYGLSALFCDYDQDGDPDLYVANDSAPNFLYRNEGNGQFRDVGVEAGAALSAEGGAQAGMGIAYGDYDGDGDGDLLVTHFEDDYNTLYGNQGNGRFAVVSAAAGLAEPSLPHLSFGTCFLDYDNDQDQDLFVANGHVYPQIRHLAPDGYAEPNQLFANQGPAGSLPLRRSRSRGREPPRRQSRCRQGGLRQRWGCRYLGLQPRRAAATTAQRRRQPAQLAEPALGRRWPRGESRQRQRWSRADHGNRQRRQLSIAQRRARPLRFGVQSGRRLDRDSLALGPRPALRGCSRQPVLNSRRAGALVPPIAFAAALAPALDSAGSARGRDRL